MFKRAIGCDVIKKGTQALMQVCDVAGVFVGSGYLVERLYHSLN